MSSRNVIRHYMRSDTGGLLVWHIRDMLRINMQWCQLKAWNALRGGSSNIFSLRPKRARWVNSKLDRGFIHCMTEMRLKWKKKRNQPIVSHKKHLYLWFDYRHLLVSRRRWRYFEVTQERAHLLSLVTDASPAPRERGFALFHHTKQRWCLYSDILFFFSFSRIPLLLSHCVSAHNWDSHECGIVSRLDVVEKKKKKKWRQFREMDNDGRTSRRRGKEQGSACTVTRHLNFCCSSSVVQ